MVHSKLKCSKIEMSESITLKSSKRGHGKWGDKGGDLMTVLILCILHFPHPHLGQIFSCKTWSLVEQKYYFCINSAENIFFTVFIWSCCSTILTFCFLELEHELRKIVINMQAWKLQLPFWSIEFAWTVFFKVLSS